MNDRKKKFFENNHLFIPLAVVVLLGLFICVYFLTSAIYANVNADETDTDTVYQISETVPTPSEKTTISDTTAAAVNTPTETTTLHTVVETTTSKRPVLTTSSDYSVPGATIISYPADDQSWQMICLNRYRCVDATVESKISLSYVAGSSERMDSRAAAAYNQMYAAAAQDGIYLTPCSGYRSYSRQKTLYFEFVNDYLDSGYSEAVAHDLASKRRNPPGSSEHNIGICMDIICAASSANFQNTEAYAWLNAYAQDYGFILRYPEDKVSVTGVKFEPWHWRYVGVENAVAIKNSGLCLEEYLGLA